MNGRRLTGIFGGTFDPVHFGHLRAALEAAERLGTDEMRLLSAARPPHREPPRAAAEDRLEMLRLAAASHPGFVVDERELRRDGPSWMVDTLEDLRRDLGDVALVLCIGQDAANGLDSWHEWRRLFELAHIAVLRRPESAERYRGELEREMAQRLVDDPRQLREAPAGRVIALPITQLDISATAIRGLVGQGRSPAFLLPRAVEDYIRRRGLYR